MSAARWQTFVGRSAPPFAVTVACLCAFNLSGALNVALFMRTRPNLLLFRRRRPFPARRLSAERSNSHPAAAAEQCAGARSCLPDSATQLTFKTGMDTDATACGEIPLHAVHDAKRGPSPAPTASIVLQWDEHAVARRDSQQPLLPAGGAHSVLALLKTPGSSIRSLEVRDSEKPCGGQQSEGALQSETRCGSDAQNPPLYEQRIADDTHRPTSTHPIPDAPCSEK